MAIPSGMTSPRRSSRYRARRAAALILGLSPPIIFALLASGTGRWDLFERSGSITTAVGLLLASRRYIQHGVLELAMSNLTEAGGSEAVEHLEDIVTSKLGLALSAFGTIVWGWGTYLTWWSFVCLAIWALFVIRDARRDSARMRTQAVEFNVKQP